MHSYIYIYAYMLKRSNTDEKVDGHTDDLGMLFELLVLDVGPVAENVAPGPPVRPLADLHTHSAPLREDAVGHHRAGPEAPVGCSGKREISPNC